MKKETFYKISIVLLVVLNLLQLGAFFFGPKPHQEPKENFKNKAVEIMNLNSKQQNDFFSFAQEHRKKMNELYQDQIQLTDHYFHQPTDSLLQLISKIETEKIKTTEQHFIEIKNILEENQYSKFDQFKKEALQNILQNQPSETSLHQVHNPIKVYH